VFACNFTLTALEQNAPETKISSAPKLRRAEIEEFLMTAKVVGEKTCQRVLPIRNEQPLTMDG